MRSIVSRIGEVMDTLLYTGHILLGLAVLAGAIAAARIGRRARADTSVTAYADLRVAGANGLFASALGVAGVGFGLAGLAGASLVPAPLSLFVIAGGVISALLAVDTTPTAYPVADAHAHAARHGSLVTFPTAAPTPGNRAA
jgi:hypothetical protein